MIHQTILRGKDCRKMDGFSAALVVKVANDAAKTAVLQNSKVIGKVHIEKALHENLNYNK